MIAWVIVVVSAIDIGEGWWKALRSQMSAGAQPRREATARRACREWTELPMCRKQ